jgi:hypothetical protein
VLAANKLSTVIKSAKKATGLPIKKTARVPPRNLQKTWTLIISKISHSSDKETFLRSMQQPVNTGKNLSLLKNSTKVESNK